MGAIPAERFRFSGQSMDEVFRWQFGAEADLDDWTLRGEIAERGDQFLHLAASDRSSLIREVNFPARDVDVIVARLDGLRAGRTRVFWAREGEQFSAEREVALPATDAVDGVYRFPVGTHPEWSGQIRHFRFDATNVSEPVSVASIAAARVTVDPADPAYGSHRGIEADDELRAGFVVSARQPRTERLSVPDGARLLFSTALLLPPRNGPAHFTITRVDGDTREEIFRRTITSPDADSRRWASGAVQLEGTGDEEAALRFALECPETDDCGGAFASIEARQGGPSERPNVVLISIDTLRADRMSLYGNSNPTTPRIDEWAATVGITFERAVAATPWTLPSHTSMLTGLDATSHNVNHNTPIPEALELLSEQLHDAGYFTAAVTGGGFVDADFGYWQGFDVFTHWRRDVSAYRRGQTESAEELPRGLQRAFSLLEEADGRPFFLFFHTYEVHAPFHAQQPYFERFYGRAPTDPGASVATRVTSSVEDGDYKITRSLYRDVPGVGTAPMTPEELPWLRAAYDSGVAYTDARIGDVLDWLEAHGMANNTIVVLTSDHGEMLGELGLGSHAYLHEPNLMIPLVISWPAELEGGKRIEAQVRTVDIAPTVMDLLGHDVPVGLDGISLVPQLEGRRTRDEPVALTYASSSGYGVSLRFGNGLKYVYENSLWRPGLVDRLAPVNPDSAAATMDFSTRAAELRQQVERILEQRDGVHMLLVNEDETRGFEVRLQGPAVGFWKLKATRLECHCARWLGRSTAELQVPAGRGYGVQFEEAPGVLSVELSDGEHTFSTAIDLGELDGPIALSRTAEGWRRTGLSDEEITRGLVVWRQGLMTSTGGEPLDEELQRRLRALGYLR